MNKVVVITGASSGLGKELARLYLKKDYILVLSGRNKKGFEEFRNNQRVEIVIGDLRIQETIDILTNIVKEKYKRIDILINNAGIIFINPFEQTREEQLDELLSIHIKVPMLLTKNLYELMKQQKFGQIINIISTSGKEGKVNQTMYCAAKFGLDGFTKALRLEAKKHNIRVIGIYPGGMKTHLFDRFTSSNIDTSSYMEPKNVAETIVFISETEAISPDEIVINRLSK